MYKLCLPIFGYWSFNLLYLIAKKKKKGESIISYIYSINKSVGSNVFYSMTSKKQESPHILIPYMI